jgi:hypothetical protein
LVRHRRHSPTGERGELQRRSPQRRTHHRHGQEDPACSGWPRPVLNLGSCGSRRPAELPSPRGAVEGLDARRHADAARAIQRARLREQRSPVALRMVGDRSVREGQVRRRRGVRSQPRRQTARLRRPVNRDAPNRPVGTHYSARAIARSATSRTA